MPKSSNAAAPQKTKCFYYDFKEMAMNFNTEIHTSTPMADPRTLGVMVMTHVIPDMWRNGETIFWSCYTDQGTQVRSGSEGDLTGMLQALRQRYKAMRMDRGDQSWFYDFKADGKTIRCIMTTEIHYSPRANMGLCATAILFKQFFGHGLHIVRCAFSEVASAPFPSG